MPGKLDLYNLGDQGVSLVPSPVHAPDGSYLAAQNAHNNVQGAQHGISKRPGLAKMTATAASGAILAFAAIPFIDPAVTVIAGKTPTEGSNLTFYSSANDEPFVVSAVIFEGTLTTWIGGRGFVEMYVPLTGINTYDGSALVVVVSNVGAPVTLSNGYRDTSEITYWFDALGVYKIVEHVLDTTYAAITGYLTTENPIVIAAFGDEPIVGGSDATGGNVHRHASGTWTEERITTEAASQTRGLVVFASELYALVKGAAAGTRGLFARNGGAWAQTVSEALLDQSPCPCAATTAGVFWQNASNQIRRWDGATTTTEFTLDSGAATLFVRDDTLYLIGLKSGDTLPALFKRTAAATWTLINTFPLGIVPEYAGYY